MLAAPICALILAASAVPAAPSHAGGWDGRRFVVHEWGTFTTVLGADGLVLEGLTHEDGDLPEFVHDIGGGLTGVSPKMETPVVYAYAPEALQLEVAVRFPRGRITHWYPSASRVNPGPAADAALAPAALADGYVDWGRYGELTLLAPHGRRGLLHGVAPHGETLDGDALAWAPVGDHDPWRFSREVRANPMEVRRSPWLVARDGGAEVEAEPLLFYRGLGDFPLPLRARVSLDERSRSRERCVVRLVLENERPDEPLTHLVLVCLREGRAGFLPLPNLSTPLDLGALELELLPIERATDALVRHLTLELSAAGLFVDEALAMARTWRHAWFGDEGLRLLYVVPRALVDRELPLEARTPPAFVARREGCEPRGPDELTRVFVARTELLGPEAHARHANELHALDRGDRTSGEVASALLARWGRLALPYLDGLRRHAFDEASRGRAGELYGELTRRLRAPAAGADG